MRRSVLLLLAALIGGCGGDGDDPAATQPAAGDRPAGAIRVVETDFELDPANARVEREGKTTFEIVNRGRTVHALEIETPTGSVEAPRIAPGESRKLEAELPAGRYTWYCPVDNHRELGMTGTIAVGGRTSGSGGSTEPEAEKTPAGGGGGYGY